VGDDVKGSRHFHIVAEAGAGDGLQGDFGLLVGHGQSHLGLWPVYCAALVKLPDLRMSLVWEVTMAGH
jgi:hypothetical protein